MMMRSAVASWGGALLLVMSACGVEPAPTTTEATPSGVSAERLDVQDLVRQARLSFHEDPQHGWVARQPLHRVRADDGVIRLTPRTWVADEGRFEEGVDLELETVAIMRGGVDQSLGLGTTRVADDGMVQIDRGVAEERIAHKAEGIEQMWYFERAPEGDGELTVRVAARGPRYVGVDREGHHFFDEVSQVGIYYSHAAFVDFDGTVTDVEVLFDAEAGELVMTIPADVLAASSFPALLDPTAGVERATTPAATAPNSALEENPAIAFDGTNYLVVWSDIRDLVSFDIWGTFINATTGDLNNRGLPIAQAAGSQRNPAVAFNGTNYLVIWEDSRRGTTFVDIMARVYDTTGAAVGAELTLSNSGVAARPRVSSLNGDWYAVWEDLRSANNSNIQVTRISGAGVADPGYALDNNPSFQVRPAIACGTTNCMVVFEGQRFAHEDINRQRIDINGLVDTVSATISGTDMGRSLAPDIAFDGTNYLVAWQDQRNNNNDIFANRVSAASGEALTEGGFAVSLATNQQTGATVSFDGTSYLVAWQDQRNQTNNGFDIFGSRVLVAGTVVHPNGLQLVDRLGDQTLPRLTRGAGQWMMTWSDTREGPPLNVRAMAITPTGGSNRSGVNVSLAANRQQAAAIGFSNAASNNLFLLVWADQRANGSDNYDIMGMRVTAAGGTLDPAGRAICTVAGNQVGPELSFNGTDFLVVWQDHRTGDTNTSVFGARVNISNANLLVREPNGFQINASAGNQLAPTVAANTGAGQWLVVYGDRRTSANTDIYATRVAADGTVVDAAGFALSTVTGVQERPDVTSNGTDWYAAWTDRRNGAALSDIYGAVITGAGVAQAEILVSGAALRQESVRLAYNGTQYLAVWADGRLGTTNSNVVGARVNVNGTVVDGGGVNLASNILLNETRPRVIAVGTNWFVTWQQSESAGAPGNDLWGRQFTSTLAGSAAAAALSATTGSEAQPAMAASSPTAAIVAYQRYDDDAAVRAERVRFRNVTLP